MATKTKSSKSSSGTKVKAAKAKAAKPKAKAAKLPKLVLVASSENGITLAPAAGKKQTAAPAGIAAATAPAKRYLFQPSGGGPVIIGGGITGKKVKMTLIGSLIET